MATYNRVTPATLANFAGVINDPTDSEDANKLAQVDLQSRRFVYDFLSTKFDPSSGDILLAAVVNDTSLAGKVKGSTSNSGTQQGIVQGTVSTPDLRNDAVSTTKILNQAVTSAKITDGNVTTTQLADAPNGITTQKINDVAVTTAKIGAKAVTSAQLASDAAVDANRAVTTDHIKDKNVTTAKINDAAVGADQFMTGAPAQILVADSGGKFRATTLSGAGTIDVSGVLSLTARGFASIREVAGNGVPAGASVATTWNVRGVATLWTKEWETAALVTIGASGHVTLAAGTYILQSSCPAYKTDEHITRITRYNSSNVFQESVYGSSERSLTASAIVTSSQAIARMVFASGDYFIVEHWTFQAEASDGLGLATSSGGASEVYASVFIQKIA